MRIYVWCHCKVSNGAKIRNRYNQVSHLTQVTNGKVTTNSSLQKGMIFCRSIYVKKVMKLLAFIFEQPSYIEIIYNLGDKTILYLIFNRINGFVGTQNEKAQQPV